MQKEVLDILHTLGISYTLDEHPAAFTMEEIEALPLFKKGVIVKNLFLRDSKGKRHFLVVLSGDKTVNLRDLGEKIGSTRLSFASEERLEKYLHLKKGSVSPLGILYDKARAVEVIFDEDLKEEACIGVHPNENTATVWLSFEDLLKIVKWHENPYSFLFV